MRFTSSVCASNYFILPNIIHVEDSILLIFCNTHLQIMKVAKPDSAAGSRFAADWLRDVVLTHQKPHRDLISGRSAGVLLDIVGKVEHVLRWLIWVACHHYHGGTHRRFTHKAQYQTLAMIHSSCTSIWSNYWYHWSICFLFLFWKQIIFSLEAFLRETHLSSEQCSVTPKHLFCHSKHIVLRWKLNSFQLEQFFQWEQFKWKHL
jgi:hypothetical protein